MKLAFVDLDYTVLVNPFWPAVFPYFARHVAAQSPSLPTAEAVIEDLMRRSRALVRGGDVAATDWDRLMSEGAAGFDVTWSEPVVALVEQHRDHARTIDGAHDMLAALRRAGWTCVAASAGYRRFQLPSLRHLGLLDCFDGLRFADDAGTPKSHLAFYGSIPKTVTHVASIGDSYVEDCLYPARFGFTAIWFTGARRSQPIGCGSAPHAHVQRLEHVADALRAATPTRGWSYRAPAGVPCPECGGPGSHDEACALCRCVAHGRHEAWDGSWPPDRRPLSG
ncbi:MAG: putative hydrolase of the superfamily [Solirubrobacteraceae bacterium]|nr:putative hydrolase of the superfamily [Solirubrobacteraceae bacterium]MEA2139010.1 putative hydrolase of the superfamily [Solirubrobacteraceae bacterium]